MSSPPAVLGAGAALGALALAAFVIGSTEFVVPGVLPELASGVHVSIVSAGLLVSGYALGVVLGGPLITAALIGRDRRLVLAGLLGFSVLGNVIAAVAPGYGVLMAGRVVASLCHGTFFGIASVVAADLAPQGRSARAIATMFLGITVANLLGVPLGAALGAHLGWRSVFWALSAAGLLALIGVVLFVPRHLPSPSGLRGELGAFGRVQVWLALAMTALGFGALYCPLTYVVPLLTRSAGFARADVSWLLALLGAGFTIGNLLGAVAGDRRQLLTLFVALAGVVTCLSVVAGLSPRRGAAAATLFLLGLFAFATVPGFTARVIAMAGRGGATLASTAAVSAFNLGNAAGAWLGGVALSAGHSVVATGLAGAAMASAALVVAGWSALIERRHGAPRPVSA